MHPLPFSHFSSNFGVWNAYNDWFSSCFFRSLVWVSGPRDGRVWPGRSLCPEEFFWLCLVLGLPRWLSGKESACQCRRQEFDLWIQKIPWRRKWQPTPVFLPGKFHGQRSLAGCTPWGCKASEMTEHTSTHMLSLGGGLWALHCSTQTFLAVRASLVVACGLSFPELCRVLVSQPGIPVSCTGRQILIHWTTRKVPLRTCWSWTPVPFLDDLYPDLRIRDVNFYLV